MPLPLSDADKIAHLAAGQPLHFAAAPAGSDPRANLAERTIQSTWIQELINKKLASIAVPIRIKNALIVGTVDLSGISVLTAVEITDSEFLDPVDCSHASFHKDIKLLRCTFRKTVRFKSARMMADLDMSLCTFHQDLLLVDMVAERDLKMLRTTVHGRTSGQKIAAREGQFHTSTFVGKAEFWGAKFESDALFCGASFGNDVSFQGTSFGGKAHFHAEAETPCLFGGQADFTDAFFLRAADFHGSEFKGDADFRSVVMNGRSNFDNAIFTRCLLFSHARMQEEVFFRDIQVHGALHFDGAIVKGNAHFHGNEASPLLFRGGSSFTGTSFEGGATFSAVEFREQADFAHTRFGGPAHFMPNGRTPVIFHKKTIFSYSQFESHADFWRSQFKGETSFIGCKFQGHVSFHESNFAGEAYLTDVVATGQVQFVGARFGESLDLRRSHFGAVVFRDEVLEDILPAQQPRFATHVDLRDFKYQRISVNWQDLLSKQLPYDRQPFDQFELSLRTAGNERTADDVLYERLSCEQRARWRDFKRWPAAIMWMFYWTIARYGVRPHLRLFLACVAFIIAGMVIFTIPASLSIRQDVAVQGQSISMGMRDALEVSIRNFLPIEIPLAMNIVPSRDRITVGEGKPIPFTAEEFAAVQRLAGWILIPLLVVAISRLLRRGSAVH